MAVRDQKELPAKWRRLINGEFVNGARLAHARDEDALFSSVSVRHEARSASQRRRATFASVRSCIVDTAIRKKAEYRAVEFAHTQENTARNTYSNT